MTTCATCTASSHLIGPKCDSCEIGYFFDKNGVCASVEDAQDTVKIVQAVYNREDDNAKVEFESDVSTIDVATFKYILIDDTDGIQYPCPKCRAEPVDGDPNALEIIFDPTIPILKGRCVVTYVVTSVVKSRRALQGTATDTKGALTNFTIENVHLSGTGRDADTSAYNAYQAVNGFRFFATVGLSVLNTGHAFWSTQWYSWLQLWAHLRGPYLVYPDRFLQWHSKWYILVINFGEPFRNWNDWDENGIKCTASTEYPLNRLGCSFTDTFGQNFIVILFVAAFCILLSVLYLLFARNTEESETGFKGWVRKITFGLGFNYFLRWIQALQPSIIYFAILQWYTHRKTSHQGLGVFLGALFFTYYFIVMLISLLLSFRISKELHENNEVKADERLDKTAKRVGGGLGLYSFLFIDMKTTKGIWQLQGTLIEFLRVVLISIFMVTLGEKNKVSLGLVFMIEVIRFFYVIATFNTKTNIFYSLIDAATGFLFIGYLILKMSSAADVSEYNRQKNLGSIMALVVTIMWGFCILDMVYDAVMGVAALSGPSKSDYSQPGGEELKNQLYTEGSPSPDNQTRDLNTNPSSPEARLRPVPDSRRPEIGNNTKRDMDENPQAQGNTNRNAPEIGDRTKREMEEGPQSRTNRNAPEIGDNTKRDMDEGAARPNPGQQAGTDTVRDLEEGPQSDNRARLAARS